MTLLTEFSFQAFLDFDTKPDFEFFCAFIDYFSIWEGRYFAVLEMQIECQDICLY